MTKICEIDGCNSVVVCRGWCNGHYHRWQRWDDPLGGGPPRGQTNIGLICRLDECSNPAHIKQLCNAHYLRLNRHGTTDCKIIYAIGTVEERFLAHVDRCEDYNCWPWIGAINGKHGYGQFNIGQGKRVTAHRFAYETFVGPIPEKHDIDHVWDNGCRMRNCVNWVGHLEPVTRGENMRRAYRARRN